MARWKRFAKPAVFLLLIVVSGVVGCALPAFYDWTGSDQSRPSPLIGQAALALTVLTILAWILLAWLPLGPWEDESRRMPRVRFHIRSLLTATLVIALAITCLMRYPMVIAGIFCATAYGAAVWQAIRDRPLRVPTVGLLACMALPYGWLVTYGEFSNALPALVWMAAGLPGLFLALLLDALVGRNPAESTWVTMIVTGLQITIGIVMIRLGPKRAIGYLIFSILMSTFGSFCLYALLRA